MVAVCFCITVLRHEAVCYIDFFYFLFEPATFDFSILFLKKGVLKICMDNNKKKTKRLPEQNIFQSG